MTAFLSTVRKRLLAGILVVIPVAITIGVLRLLFAWLDGILGPAVWWAMKQVWEDSPRIPGVGVVATLLLVYVAGLLAANMIGRRLFGWMDAVFGRIPLARSIYGAIKQLLDSMTLKSSSFHRVVLVRFPTPQCWAVAFVTNELDSADGVRLLSVFVPTTPNPTSGFALVVREDEAIATSYGVDEGITFVMSAGVVPFATGFPALSPKVSA